MTYLGEKVNYLERVKLPVWNRQARSDKGRRLTFWNAPSHLQETGTQITAPSFQPRQHLGCVRGGRLFTICPESEVRTLSVPTSPCR